MTWPVLVPCKNEFQKSFTSSSGVRKTNESTQAPRAWASSCLWSSALAPLDTQVLPPEPARPCARASSAAGGRTEASAFANSGQGPGVALQPATPVLPSSQLPKAPFPTQPQDKLLLRGDLQPSLLRCLQTSAGSREIGFPSARSIFLLLKPLSALKAIFAAVHTGRGRVLSISVPRQCRSVGLPRVTGSASRAFQVRGARAVRGPGIRQPRSLARRMSEAQLFPGRRFSSPLGGLRDAEAPGRLKGAAPTAPISPDASGSRRLPERRLPRPQRCFLPSPETRLTP